jgi:hypothetical protein
MIVRFAEVSLVGSQTPAWTKPSPISIYDPSEENVMTLGSDTGAGSVTNTHVPMSGCPE